MIFEAARELDAVNPIVNVFRGEAFDAKKAACFEDFHCLATDGLHRCAFSFIGGVLRQLPGQACAAGEAAARERGPLLLRRGAALVRLYALPQPRQRTAARARRARRLPGGAHLHGGGRGDAARGGVSAGEAQAGGHWDKADAGAKRAGHTREEVVTVISRPQCAPSAACGECNMKVRLHSACRAACEILQGLGGLDFVICLL